MRPVSVKTSSLSEADSWSDPVPVAFVLSDLGLGGTAKGAVSLVTRLDRERFAPVVLCLDDAGPRESTVRSAGIEVRTGLRDVEALTAALRGTAIVHVVRHGIAEPLVPEAARRASVPVLVETNIFGARDRTRDERQFSCHLFISQMCLMRYRSWLRGGGPSFGERHRVGFLPVEGARLRSLAPGQREARLALGLDPDRPVVARVGRSADLKWRNIVIDMIPHLTALEPSVQVLLVGATKAKRARLARHGMLDRVHLVEPVADEAALAGIYAASDVVVTAAAIGESQGVALAEAMAFERPVITSPTPWADNAQIEWVINGETGWLADHPRPFAEAVVDLLRNPERRAAFGRRAREQVDARLDPDKLTRQLESLYRHHLQGTAVEWTPDAAEQSAFEREYPARAASSFRPLTGSERAHAARARALEWFDRRTASLRMVADRFRGS
jgi:glycosyltransferase involved in cell wall biosynthesis